MHEKFFHKGVNGALNFLRNKYWLFQGRQRIIQLNRPPTASIILNSD